MEPAVTPRAGTRITDAIARSCGALAALLGLIALGEWIFDRPLPTGLDPGWIPMAPSTALLFLLLGSVIYFVARVPPHRTASRIGIGIGAAATLIALFLFILSYQGIHLNAEHFGFAISGTVGGVPIGHMSPATALGFLLAGVSLVAVLASLPSRAGWAMAGFWLAALNTLGGSVFLLGYLFGAPLLYGGNIIPPALPTAIGMAALGIALLALAGPRAWAPGRQIDAATLRASTSFWLIFALMAVGLIKAGGIYYDQDVKQNRGNIERELSAIANLKVSELVRWREERLGNATVLYGNTAFAALVRRGLGSAPDAAARDQLYAWLRQIQQAYGYAEVHLIDVQGIARFSLPAVSPTAGEIETARLALRSGQIRLDDIHRDKAGEAPHLSLLVPIMDATVAGRPLAIVMLEIDPLRDLYPLLERWPTFSRSAETVLVRRDGSDVLYLNDLRDRKNTALTLRYPLSMTENSAVKAVLGQQGIVEGTDASGVPVIAALRAVPGTPWFLVTQMNRDEFLAAIQESLWLTAGLVTALLLSAAAALGLIWRHQRVRHYRERAHDAEALARMTRLYAALSQCNEAIVRCSSEEKLFPQICRVAVQFGGMKTAWIGLIETDTRMLKPVASFGDAGNYLGNIEISVDVDGPLGNSMTSTALRENRPFWSLDYLNAPITASWRERSVRGGIAASASLPLHRNGVVIGAFCLYSATVNAFDEQARTLLVEMAKDIDFALDNFERELKRRRAEDETRAAEERFRGLIEQSIAGIYIIQDGKFAYVNARFAEIAGCNSAEDLIGTDPLLWIYEANRGRAAEYMRRLLDGEAKKFTLDYDVPRQDGVKIRVGANITYATYEGRPAILGMMQDISEKNRAEEKIQLYIEQLKTAVMSTVEVATTLSEMRDPYTAGHERRVAQIAVAIGAELGFDQSRQEGLRVAGCLHDIGKINIPAEILSKPGKLSVIEYQLIQGHPQAGYDVLKTVEFPWPVAQVAFQHHERIDGSGYPQGLKGEAILLEARIMAVADVVEAMSSHRPYRPGLGIEMALAEIERGRGTAYDAAVADACLRLFREKGCQLPA